MPASRSTFRWWETVGWERSNSGTSSQTHTLPACFRSTSTSCMRIGSPSAFATLGHPLRLVALDVGIDDRLAARLARRVASASGQAPDRQPSIYVYQLN